MFFFALFFGGGIALYAYGQTDTSNTATNIVNIGKVEVELAMETDNANTITPGDNTIANEIKVSNTGNYPMYVRVFVKKYWEIKKDGVALSTQEISNDTVYQQLATSKDAIAIHLGNGWIEGVNSNLEYDVCYYYNRVVNIDENDEDVNNKKAILFSDSYQVKEGTDGITNDMLLYFSKNEVNVFGNYKVYVEAIQADTCIPVISEINSMDMITNWNESADDSAHAPTISIDPNASPEEEVNFTSENTEITNANEFINIEDLLPGQTEEKVVEIKNTSNQKLPVYVYAETAEDYNSLTDDQKKWLQQLQLIVTKQDGQTLYNDSLYKSNSRGARFSSNNQIEIGELSPGEREKLYIAIHCPASWETGGVQVKVNWIFSSKKAIPDPTKRPSGGGGSVIIVTNTPIVTEEPVMETEVPVTDMPEPTETPEVTLLPTATLEVTASPIVTQIPTEKPEETSVVVTETPDWDEEEEETTEPVTPEPTKRVTEVPSPTAEATDEIQPLKSEEPDNVEPIETLEPDLTSDERPRRTSTPKLPTIVEEVYPTKTGDATPIVVWLVLFVVSWIGMFVAFTAYRKRK